MSSTELPSLPEFVEALQKGGSVTQNWDVAVSYNAMKINQRLADSFSKQDASGMIQYFDVSFDDVDRWGDYTQYYHIELGPPLIEFVPTTAVPTCNLTMRVMGGQMWTADSENGESSKVDISAGKYTITFAGLVLAAAEGSTLITDKVVDVPNPTTRKTEITVCLDFPTSSKYLVVNVNFPEGDRTAMRNSLLPTMIKDQLQESSSGMKYQLASVNNEVPSENFLDLVPSKFIFVTFSPNEDQSSPETSLTLLIQTYGSDTSEGDTAYVQASWITTWKNLNVAPIPGGHTASIFINNSFFMQKYIKAGLGALPISELTELVAPDGGLRITGKWKHPLQRNSVTKRIMDPDMEHLPLEPTLYESTVPTVDYDPNQGGQNFTLTFAQGNGTDNPGTANISWSWVFNDSWTGKQIWRVPQKDAYGGMTWMPQVNYPKGTYRVDFSLNKTFNAPTVDDEEFSMAMEVGPSDWAAPSTNTSSQSAWDQFLSFFPFSTINNSNTPQWAADAVPRPTFTLDLHTLRFFLVTNILLPGEKVIKVDSTAGLLFPRDVLIVGDVI